jgi:hypothetical protein
MTINSPTVQPLARTASPASSGVAPDADLDARWLRGSHEAGFMSDVHGAGSSCGPAHSQ